jgi:hypothetical protein
VRIEERRDADFRSFWAPVEAALERAASLEEAAQTFCERFYQEFAESAVLVRAFVTLPFEALPAAEAAFARKLALATRNAPQLAPATPVLTLLGSYGIEPQWRVRLESRAHLAVPLLSDESVAEIPMIARLLREIGFPSLGSGPADWQFVNRVGGGDGLFFVGDAQTTTDERGRPIIPSVDFIDRYGVKSVFGFGGPQSGSVFLAVIVFCRQTIMRSNAVRFVPFIENLRLVTSRLLRERTLFAG